MSKVVLRLVGTAAGKPTEFDGKFLEYYDPSYCPKNLPYDGGALLVTPDLNQAMQFKDAAAALEKWRESYGVRADGQPNRPLTAFSVEVVPAPERTQHEQNS